MNIQILRSKLYRGMLSRVARELRVTRQHVWEVANGKRPSARVEAALQTEYKRIEREVKKLERHNRKRVA